MTLPEKVRDVTQSEWLEVRERLAAAEANAERWRQDAGSAHGRYSGVLSALRRVEGERDEALRESAGWQAEAGEWEERYNEAHHQHCAEVNELASQLALAMAWGAEVCGMLDETEHAMHMRVRGEYDRTIADSWRAKVAEVEQRAERAEAERDEARKTIADARWAMANDHVESVVRAILDGVGMDAGCRDEYRHDVEIAEAERDALLSRLGSPDTHPGIAWQSLNRERDEARERAQVAECEVQSWKDECGRWEERVGEVEARLLAVTTERDEAQRGRTSVSAVNAALRDYPDADVSALWVPALEALEYQACWHRDVAKGRAALEKAEAERDAMRKERDAWIAVVDATVEAIGAVVRGDLAEAAKRLVAERNNLRAQLAQTEESLRLARNEILSGIDAEQLRITREIQAARRDAERQRDVARSERDHAYDNADSIWAGVVGRLTKERDAARAQLAAVVAAAKAVIHVSVPPYTEEGTKLLRAWNAVLADPAQAAHEHEERVRAEERERCESKVAEWQAIAGNATEAANAAWGHFAEVALLLGYKRAASPDFGEVDLVPLRERIRALGSRP